MVHVNLDFVEGEEMIVMRHSSFTLEHFSGNYRIMKIKGLNNAVCEYGTGKESNYSEEMIPADQCFKSVEELLEKTGLNAIAENMSEKD